MPFCWVFNCTTVFNVKVIVTGLSSYVLSLWKCSPEFLSQKSYRVLHVSTRCENFPFLLHACYYSYFSTPCGILEYNFVARCLGFLWHTYVSFCLPLGTMHMILLHAYGIDWVLRLAKFDVIPRQRVLLVFALHCTYERVLLVCFSYEATNYSVYYIEHNDLK